MSETNTNVPTIEPKSKKHKRAVFVNENNGGLKVANCETIEEINAALRKTFGTEDVTLSGKLMVEMQLVLQAFHGKKLEGAEVHNMTASIVAAIQPRDALEGMLATQMAAVHIAAMSLTAGIPDAVSGPGQDRAANFSIKMLRTFAAQMETLKRYRSKGQQKVTVEHVNVNEGGQAIVGSVVPGGDGVQ